MATKGALQMKTSVAAVEVMFADPTCMGVLLVEQGYTHLVACTWEIGTTAIEGDDIIGGRTVMGLVEFAGTVCFLSAF